jgi:hypothetical protein
MTESFHAPGTTGSRDAIPRRCEASWPRNVADDEFVVLTAQDKPTWNAHLRKDKRR